MSFLLKKGITQMQYSSDTTIVIQKLISIQELVSDNLKIGSADGWVVTNQNLMHQYTELQAGLVHMLKKNGMEIEEIAEGLGISEKLVNEALAKKWTRELGVGAIVQSKNTHGDPLHCGSGTYPNAVVISMSPFIMASTSADMRWSTWSADRVKVVSYADDELLAKCMTRLEK